MPDLTSLFYRVLDHRRLIAAICAGIAVFAALASVRESDSGPRVLVVAHDISSGATLKDSDVQNKRVPAGLVPAHALTSTTQVAGRRVAGPMRQGEILTDRRVLEPAGADRVRSGNVVARVPIADATTASAVRVGDQVNVFAIDTNSSRSTIVIARDVEVLAVEASAQSQPTILDVSVTEQVALKIAEAGVKTRLGVLVSAANSSNG